MLYRPYMHDDFSMSANYQPTGPVTLTAEQIVDLHQKFRAMRHDVNGRLANIVAAAELIRMRPSSLEERMHLLLEQPQKAAESMAEFAAELEQRLGLTPDGK